MSLQYTILEKQDGVATVTLNREALHNAFNDIFIQELVQVFEDLSADKELKLIVLTGKGKSFCAGADLNWMKSMIDYSLEENIEDSKHLLNLFHTINDVEIPVIAKTNGHALGGGVGLLSVCDYVIATDRAKLGFTEVKLGLIPAVISPFVIKKIGESHARAWFLSGEIFTSKKAQEIGLVHEVCSKEELDNRTTQVINSFLKAGPIAAKNAKKLIKNVSKKIQRGSSDEDLGLYTCTEIGKRRMSEEGQEGMKALLEKRKASWIHD